MKNKKNLFLIVSIIGVVVLIFLVVWIIRVQTTIDVRDLSQTQEEKERPGETGEVTMVDESGQEVPLKTAVMPVDIFSTSGTIVSVKRNGLVALTEGFSFADGQPREVELVFTSQTVVRSADRSQRWTGLEGLDHLSSGMMVLVDSDENIRGKTKYQVKNVYILP